MESHGGVFYGANGTRAASGFRHVFGALRAWRQNNISKWRLRPSVIFGICPYSAPAF